MSRDICTPMFISVFFTIAKIWKHLGFYIHASGDKQIKKIWYTHALEYYPAVKKKEIFLFVTTWMDLEGIMLSEIHQMQKDEHHTILLIYRTFKTQTQRSRKQSGIYQGLRVRGTGDIGQTVQTSTCKINKFGDPIYNKI